MEKVCNAETGRKKRRKKKERKIERMEGLVKCAALSFSDNVHLGGRIQGRMMSCLAVLTCVCVGGALPPSSQIGGSTFSHNTHLGPGQASPQIKSKVLMVLRHSVLSFICFPPISAGWAPVT